MEKCATVKIILSPVKCKTDPDRHPIAIRVTWNRENRKYSTGSNKYITTETFNNPRLKECKIALEEAQFAFDIANDICQELGGNFSFTEFAEKYRKRLFNKQDQNLFSTKAQEYVEHSNLSIKSVSLYKTTINWVLSYRKNLLLYEMTTDFIEGLIKFMKKKHLEIHKRELSENTLRIYLRNLKAMCSYFVKKEYIATNPLNNLTKQSLHSISRQKYDLADNELISFMRYKPENEKEEFSHDFFILSIQLSGANTGDILSLRNKNINKNEIAFIRRKTKRSGKITTIPLTKTAKKIIEKYGKINKQKPEDYILPFLSHCKTENQINNKIHDINRKINKGLASIAPKIGLERLTTYVARHTYANAALEKLDITEIQLAMGHTDYKVTETYIKSLRSRAQKKNTALLDELAGLGDNE